MSFELTHEQKLSLAETVLAKATKEERRSFFATCERSGLDPFSRQISATFRWNKDAGREVLQVVVNIDGFRTIAARSGKYRGQNGPWWCGKDGQWRDVWLDQNPPAAAKVEIIHADFDKPLVSVATWDQYVQTTKDGSPNRMWKSMGPFMLAKCAEALGLRRAFPETLSGLYTADEMGQASNPEPDEPMAVAGTSGKERAAAAIREAGAKVTTAALVEEKFGPERANNLIVHAEKVGMTLDDIRAGLREAGVEPLQALDKTADYWPYKWKAEIVQFIDDTAKSKATPDEPPVSDDLPEPAMFAVDGD